MSYLNTTQTNRILSPNFLREPNIQSENGKSTDYLPTWNTIAGLFMRHNWMVKDYSAIHLSVSKRRHPKFMVALFVAMVFSLPGIIWLFVRMYYSKEHTITISKYDHAKVVINHQQKLYSTTDAQHIEELTAIMDDCIYYDTMILLSVASILLWIVCYYMVHPLVG